METKKDKFVLKMPEDAIRSYDDGACCVNLYVSPYGDKQINEVMDTVYYKNNHYIPYHYMGRGTETLLILRGKVEVTLYGKACECEEGDYINIPAHCPYSLRTMEEDCVIRGLYTELDMSSKYENLELLRKNALSCSYSADFIENEFNPEHNHFALTEPANLERVEKDALPQITSKGRSIYEYDGWKGINCQLKVGRWNLNRVKEIWQFTIDQGYQLQYFKPNKNESLYSVESGKVRVEVNGETLFAEKNDMIHIPQYTPFALTAMSEKTVIQDFNVSARLFRMLEMLELAQREEPEKPADSEWLMWLLDMNGSNLTGFIYNDK